MNLGTNNRKETFTALGLGVLALGACFYIYEEVFATGDTPAAVSAPAAPARTAPAAAAAPHAARTVANSGTMDPTLHIQSMLVSESLPYSGAGRNIFSTQSAPPATPIPQPVASARPAPVAPQPCPPNCPPPPPPPPIDLKYFGIETGANGARQACLLHGDAVYLASAGDVVLSRYKVVSIDPKFIQVQDTQTNNVQTLPLLSN